MDCEGGCSVHAMLMWKLEDISSLAGFCVDGLGGLLRFEIGLPIIGCGSAYSGNWPKD